jgi:hypothetical protein
MDGRNERRIKIGSSAPASLRGTPLAVGFGSAEQSY